MFKSFIIVAAIALFSSTAFGQITFGYRAAGYETVRQSKALCNLPSHPPAWSTAHVDKAKTRLQITFEDWKQNPSKRPANYDVFVKMFEGK